jgi:hypothetical protein
VAAGHAAIMMRATKCCTTGAEHDIICMFEICPNKLPPMQHTWFMGEVINTSKLRFLRTARVEISIPLESSILAIPYNSKQ